MEIKTKVDNHDSIKLLFRDYLRSFSHGVENEVFQSGSLGYWSNLSKEENRRLLEALEIDSAHDAILKHQPLLESVIYSPKRPGGLELLELNGDEICVDYGCMWGALTVPLAKRTRFVLGIDQTPDSLHFLGARIKEEEIQNVALLCHDIRKLSEFPQNLKADVAVVNGVLEWIPESGPIELKTYFGKYKERDYKGNPRKEQLAFLKQVHLNLSPKGKLYLAIENRYDFKMFLGGRDPHTNLFFTTVLPRSISNVISRIFLGRPYINWIYSFREIRELLLSAGFSDVQLNACYPDYGYPDNILPYSSDFSDFETTISPNNSRGKRTIKRTLAREMEMLLFRVLKLRFLAPSIIAIAKK